MHDTLQRAVNSDSLGLMATKFINPLYRGLQYVILLDDDRSNCRRLKMSCHRVFRGELEAGEKGKKAACS